MCKPKSDRGLGVRDLRLVNKAFLDKWRWILLHGGGLWHDIIYVRYESICGSMCVMITIHRYEVLSIHF